MKFACRKSSTNGWVRSLAILGAVIAIALAGGIVISASALGPQAAAAATAVPLTIFQTTTPAVLADPDTNSVELGLQFRSAVAGKVTGLRFYKATTNTGTHTGSLWQGGTRLATVTFSAETASGWQAMSFPTALPVTPGATYTVSYLAPRGRYSVNSPYSFPKTNSSLTAISGVYRYGGGYPTSTYQASNYWVDVLFTPTSAPATTTPAITTTTSAITTTTPTTTVRTTTSSTTTPPTSSATSVPPVTG